MFLIVANVRPGSRAEQAGVLPNDVLFWVDEMHVPLPLNVPRLLAYTDNGNGIMSQLGQLMDQPNTHLVFARKLPLGWKFLEAQFPEGLQYGKSEEVVFGALLEVEDAWKKQSPFIVVCGSVFPKSRAERAGLKPNDVILSFGSYRMSCDSDPFQFVSSKLPYMETADKHLVVARNENGKWQRYEFTVPAGKMGAGLSVVQTTRDVAQTLVELSRSIDP